MKIRANAENIKTWLETINTFNSTSDFGTTRVLFTDVEVKAREYVKSEMKKLNLQVHEDAIGNIFGVLEGTRPDLPPVWTGSHIDTVLNAGMFDGMSGVVAGLEAARLIQANNLKHERNIVIIVYTSEEPTRFKLGCLGSRALAGKLDEEKAKQLTDNNGSTLYDVLKKLGFSVQNFPKVPIKKGSVYGAVELHIDQNGILEKAKKTIGIVKTICAPSVLEAQVIGRQSHAGGTNMQDRCDAFMATAEIALALEKLGRNSISEYTTATIGKIEVVPNAENVIPGKVIFSIDIRDCDYECKNHLISDLKEKIKEIEAERKVQVKLTQYNNDYPMKCDTNIIKKLENACEKEHIPYIKTISGAFHDSMLVGEFAPVAMIFVPSRNGISHSPDEWTDFGDIATGTDVLTDVLVELANEI